MSKESFAKGEHYDRLLKEFIDKGGDMSLCPFDTQDYRWQEPSSTDEWELEYQKIINK